MRRVVRVALLVGFALCACSRSAGHTAGVAPAPGIPRTGTFRFTIAANGTGRASPLLAAHGAFDRERRRYSMTVDAGSIVPGIDGFVQLIGTADTLYLDAPSLVRVLRVPTRWISATNRDEVVAALLPDPLALLDELPSEDVDVVRDAGGLVHRVVVRFDAGEPGGAVVTLEYFDVGQPVTIEPPPVEQVTDESSALQRLAGRTGG